MVISAIEKRSAWNGKRQQGRIRVILLYVVDVLVRIVVAVRLSRQRQPVGSDTCNRSSSSSSSAGNRVICIANELAFDAVWRLVAIVSSPRRSPLLFDNLDFDVACSITHFVRLFLSLCVCVCSAINSNKISSN